MCSYAPDERAECPYCSRVFTEFNGLIDHLLLTRLKSNTVIKTFPWPSSTNTTSYNVMQTGNVFNEHSPSTMAPKMPLSNMPYLHHTVPANEWNPASAASENTFSDHFPFDGIKAEINTAETELLEGIGAATHDVYDSTFRSTLTPYISDMRQIAINLLSRMPLHPLYGTIVLKMIQLKRRPLKPNQNFIKHQVSSKRFTNVITKFFGKIHFF